jgi:hypothetical protein
MVYYNRKLYLALYTIYILLLLERLLTISFVFLVHSLTKQFVLNNTTTLLSVVSDVFEEF